MKFRGETLKGIAERIAALGLRACPICDSAALVVSRKPVILPIGGSPWSDNEVVSAGSNILYMVAVICDVCGHTMLFDSERFHHGDEVTLERE